MAKRRRPDKDRKPAQTSEVKKPQGEQIVDGTRHQTNGTLERSDTPKANAVFVRWNAERGFGFLRTEKNERAFCHVTELCAHLQPDRGNSPDMNAKIHVEKVVGGQKDARAKKVQCLDCATPTIWELQPVGEALWGVREMKPVCTNKPNEPSYNSTIPYRVIYEANEAFREAQEKQKIWDCYSPFDSQFIELFGEPEKITLEEDDQLALRYSHGSKKISAYSAFGTNRLEASPTGSCTFSEYGVQAEFELNDVPSAKNSIQVVSGKHTPRLTKEFEKLPEDLQQKIIETVKKDILSPEDYAAKQFESYLESGDTHLQKLREELIDLEGPGKLEYASKSGTGQAEGTASYGGETWGTGRYHDVNTISYFLLTGCRKVEFESWRLSFHPHREHYNINRYYDQHETPEAVRDALVAERKSSIERELHLTNAPIPDEPRLYDISSEEWSKRFELQAEKLLTTLRQKWKGEDRLKSAQLEANYEEYESLCDELRAIRKVYNELLERTSKSSVCFDDDERPDYGNINRDSTDELRAKIVAIREFIPKGEEKLVEMLREREVARTTKEQQREEAVRQEKASLTARMTNFGMIQGPVDAEPIDLKHARRAVCLAEEGNALAIEAEAIIGTAAALELLEGELNAPYGRGGQQVAIEERLGELNNKKATAPLNYTRAHDLFVALSAAVHYLKERAPQPPTKASVPQAKVVFTEGLRAVEAVSNQAITVSDLLGKFGGSNDKKKKGKKSR